MQPTEPNTPPASIVWKVIHFPLTLLFIGAAFVIGGTVLAQLLGKAFPPAHDSPGEVLLAAAVAAIVAGAYVLFVRLIERRPVDEFGARGWVGELGGGFAIGFALFSLVIGATAVLGGYHVLGTQSLSVLYPVIAISIVSGVTEEVIMRGLFFRLLERWLGSWAALALSAALFGALHLGNPNATWLAAVGIAFEAGIMLAAVYMITRRLWAAIGLHAAWNFAEGGIYGTPISGSPVDSILRARMSGSELLTGGGFGPEAGLPAMVLATAFGVAMLIVAHRRGRFVAPMWVRQTLPPAQGVAALQA